MKFEILERRDMLSGIELTNGILTTRGDRCAIHVVGDEMAVSAQNGGLAAEIMPLSDIGGVIMHCGDNSFSFAQPIGLSLIVRSDGLTAAHGPTQEITIMGQGADRQEMVGLIQIISQWHLGGSEIAIRNIDLAGDLTIVTEFQGPESITLDKVSSPHVDIRPGGEAVDAALIDLETEWLRFNTNNKSDSPDTLFLRQRIGNEWGWTHIDMGGGDDVVSSEGTIFARDRFIAVGGFGFDKIDFVPVMSEGGWLGIGAFEVDSSTGQLDGLSGLRRSAGLIDVESPTRIGFWGLYV